MLIVFDMMRNSEDSRNPDLVTNVTLSIINAILNNEHIIFLGRVNGMGTHAGLLGLPNNYHYKKFCIISHINEDPRDAGNKIGKAIEELDWETGDEKTIKFCGIDTSKTMLSTFEVLTKDFPFYKFEILKRASMTSNSHFSGKNITINKEVIRIESL